MNEAARSRDLLFYSKDFPIDRYPIIRSRWTASCKDSLRECLASGPSVVLFDKTLQQSGSDDHFDEAVLIGLGVDPVSPQIEAALFSLLPADPDETMLLLAIERCFEFLLERRATGELEEELRLRSQELQEMNNVGMALSTLRDRDGLLIMILTKSRELSRADAGSLYLLDEDESGNKALRWKLAQNDSIPVDFQEKLLPITKKSLAGYVALTGETLNLDDAYHLPEGAEYTFNSSFDVANGYLTRSLLVFPMMNQQGDIIGVIQLINRRKPGSPARLTASNVPANVTGFDARTVGMMRSLGGQAAVAVENNLLYDSIERLFEGFVTASVTAIEQRDPTTSGHSFRVADLTVLLARTVDSIDTGRFATTTFSLDQLREIRYASLLHDFGKVGVREKVLVKEKKLYPLQTDLIHSRFQFLMKSAEADVQRRLYQLLLTKGESAFAAERVSIENDLEAELAQLRSDYDFVLRSNEPTVLPEGEFQYLQELGGKRYTDANGVLQRLLSEEEVQSLSIRKGNLDVSERVEIESHVTNTYSFLSKIPWTRDLKNVPNIAYAHHEKVNGKGYPRALPSDAISIQSRMMTVSDIYDALTAKDRPYKKAVPTDRALDILNMEVRDGFLDDALVQLFIEAKVYENPMRTI